jgi:hypothetical protein
LAHDCIHAKEEEKEKKDRRKKKSKLTERRIGIEKRERLLPKVQSAQFTRIG